MTSKLLSKPVGNMDWYDLFSFVLAQFEEKRFLCYNTANESYSLFFSTVTSWEAGSSFLEV